MNLKNTFRAVDLVNVNDKLVGCQCKKTAKTEKLVLKFGL